MVRWFRQLFASEPLDLDAVLRSTHFGTVDSEVVELVRLATGTADVPAAPFGSPAPGRFLDARTLVIVRWRDWPHVRIYDDSWRYAAVVPTQRDLRHTAMLHFLERGGVQFSVRPWSAETTTLFTGTTSGQVVTETNGATIGTCHQGGARVDGIPPSGHLRGPGGEWVANILYAPGKTKYRERVVACAGQELAHLYNLGFAKTASDRAYCAWVVEFGAETTSEVQALTLAYVLCEWIQSEEDLDV
jgi:hypothetical protein